MTRRRLLILLAVAAALGTLFYLQFRAWEDFDWTTFFRQTRRADPRHIAAAIVIIYSVYVLRALRWKIFLQPTCHVALRRLVAPTIIGFTGIALLGRPGELIRPYLIARKEGLSISSQLAVWTVERIFDLGSLALLLSATIFFAPSLRGLPYFTQFRRGAFLLLVLLVVFTVLALLLHHRSAQVAAWVAASPIAPRAAGGLARRLRSFGQGLDTLRDTRALAEATGLSILIWVFIAWGAFEVTNAYPEPLRSLHLPEVVLLLGFSVLGSLANLPAVGGGTQLAAIVALANVFQVPQELAVSCGILLWLVTFLAVVPVGLFLAHREHVSLRRLSEESQG